jgi:hypothetical protein
MSKYNLKFTSKQGLKFINKHYHFAENTLNWELVNITYDTSDKMSCSICGHKPIRYLFFVAPKGHTGRFMVGSICIQKWFMFSRLDKQTLKRLKKELLEYAKLFRLSKESNEWKNKALELSDLRTMKQDLERAKKEKEQAEKDVKRKVQREIYSRWLDLEETSTLFFNTWELRFYHSTIEWFNSGKAWTNRQLDTVKKIMDHYENITEEELQEAKEQETIFKEDLNLVLKLKDVRLWDKHRQFIDSVHFQLNEYQRPLSERQRAYVDRLIIRYRKQIDERKDFENYLNNIGDIDVNDVSLEPKRSQY